MSIIKLAGQNASKEVDPEVGEADTEVELRILDVRVDLDKNGNAYFMPRFESTEDPNMKDFTKFFSIPGDNLEAKKLKSAKNSIRKFGEAFGFDADEDLDTDELTGLTGWAILGVEDNEDSQYGPQNYIKKFVVQG